MNTTMKVTAWICICSTLFMGCYISTMISPTGKEKGLIYTNKIETILTKDSTQVAFDSPPVVLSDTTVRKCFVSIPSSDVSDIYTKDSSHFVVTNDGATYQFDTRPIIETEGLVAGEATDYLLYSVVVGDTNGVRVVIPFGNIKEVQRLRYDTGRAIGIGVAMGLTILIVVALMSWHGSSKPIDLRLISP